MMLMSFPMSTRLKALEVWTWSLLCKIGLNGGQEGINSFWQQNIGYSIVYEIERSSIRVFREVLGTSSLFTSLWACFVSSRCEKTIFWSLFVSLFGNIVFISQVLVKIYIDLIIWGVNPKFEWFMELREQRSCYTWLFPSSSSRIDTIMSFNFSYFFK